MTLKLALAASLLALSAAPGFAQSAVPDSTTPNPPKPLPYDRGYDKPSARADSINAAEGPQTEALNSGQAASSTVAASQDAQNQAQYEADRQAYEEALVAHDATVVRSDDRWRHQQTAYADAMAAWRAQVAACKAGHQRACNMPSPTPDQFY